MADLRRITPLPCGQSGVGGAGSGDDEAIAALAARQHGVVARAQLLSLGIGPRAIDHRIDVGRLRRLFLGTYAVGHDAIGLQGRALAAVMSLAPNAVASHHTALALHGLAPPPRGVVHITTLKERAPRPGVALHRGALPAGELTRIGELPVTGVARTLLDIAPTTPPPRLRRLIKDAEFRGLVRIPELREILGRYPRRRGRGNLAAVVTPLLAQSGLTRSPLEDDFLDFCTSRGLPPPETNVRLAIGDRVYEVDCLWRQSRLIVELDGRDAHLRELAFEDDRARDRALIAAGWAPMRVTSGHLRFGADALEGEIRRTLDRRGDPRRITHTGGG